MSDLPKPPAHELVGPGFGETTLRQLVDRTIAGHLHGIGNAVEANFVYRLDGKDFIVHMHLCVRGDAEAPAVKH